MSSTHNCVTCGAGLLVDEPVESCVHGLKCETCCGLRAECPECAKADETIRVALWRSNRPISRLVFCEDCGRITGHTDASPMDERRKTTLCRECSWRRTFALARDGYFQKYRTDVPRKAAVSVEAESDLERARR